MDKVKRSSKLLSNNPKKKNILHYVATKNEKEGNNNDNVLENYQKIIEAIEKKQFITGILKSVTRKVNSTTGKTDLIFNVDLLGFECIVYESHWWMPETKILYRPELSYITLEEASYSRALKMINSRVPIVPHKIKKISEVKDKLTDKVTKKYLLFGSRVYGMKTLQDIWFFHKFHKETYTVEKGDDASARVLFANRNNVCVECFGVETYITSVEASSNFVADCRDLFKPGDEIKVTVKSVKVEEENIRLFVSARIYENKLRYSSSKIDEIKKKSAYFAKVTHISDNGHYVVLLSNGVIGDVSPTCIQSGAIVSPGDDVVFVCTGVAKDKSLVFGVITK